MVYVGEWLLPLVVYYIWCISASTRQLTVESEDSYFTA